MLVDVINVIMILQMTFRCDHDIAHTVTFILEKLRSHEPVIFFTVLGHYLPWLQMISENFIKKNIYFFPVLIDSGLMRSNKEFDPLTFTLEPALD